MKRRTRLGTMLILIAASAFNYVAYNQAYSMLHFTESGVRTLKPEALSIWQKAAVLVMGINIPKPVNLETPEAYDLVYETHWIRNNDIELEAWYLPVAQSSATIVMFHGYAAAKSSMLAEAQAFNELGYSTFLIDFRGSGGSNQSNTSIGYFEAEDVEASVTYVRNMFGQQQVILYGQSMGSVAILRAVAELNVKPNGIIIEAVFDTMAGTVANRFKSMELPTFPATQILIFWASVISGHWGFDHNPVDYAAQITRPTLMLHGSADTRATLAQGRAVFEQLNTTSKQLKVFEGIGHESYVVAYPNKWMESVSQISQWLD